MAEVYDGVEVQEGPEIEVGSYDEEVTDTESRESVTDTSGSEMSETEGQDQPVGLGPENNIYEVDMILDGPRKRKEHNFLVCYKIRWKNFGEEADSWQPLSDLENVMYMVDEYNQQRRQVQKKRREKFNKKMVARKIAEPTEPTEPLEDSQSSSGTGNTGSTSDLPNEEAFNPLFGHLKDRFWKKLEMGVLDDQVFEGDMYSKVKGSRRAAHADAAMNIKKMQKPPSSLPPTSSVKRLSSPSKFTPKQKQRKSLSSRSSALSNSTLATSTLYNHKQGSLGSATKGRKRSSDPFSARGYMSAKRSRRSREHNRRTASSVTSVTMGIVSLNGDNSSSLNGDNSSSTNSSSTNDVERPKPVKNGCEPVVQAMEDVSDHRTVTNTTEPSHDSYGEKKLEDTPKEIKKTEKDGMTVTSETMLTVTSEHTRLKPEDIIQPEEIFKLKYDDWFLPDSTSLPETDTKAIIAITTPVDGSKSPSTACGETQWPLRSTFETMAEANGAVEKSHNEECQWGGACNRSDCKSNRRWNMKNGKEEKNKEKSDKDSVKPVSNSGSSSNLPSSQLGSSSSSSSSHQSSRKHQHDKRTHLVNKRSLDYDSSFDEPGPSSQDRDAMSCGLMNALAHRMHADTIASSNTNKNSLLTNCSLPSERVIPPQSIGSNSSTSSTRGDNNVSYERPGLFSDNSAFSFMRENPTSSTHSSPAPSSSSNSPGSINLTSPGKENFRTSSGGSNINANNSNSVLPGAYGRFQSSSIQDHVSSSSSVRPNNPTDFSASPEGWSLRKRPGDLSGPLEKIPSPNSRRGSDLDRRIASITCDELEDIDTQGEDRFGKSGAFITNVDLLQAVNLSKAEVVRRAIKQAADSNRLDFEQRDNTGLTLLMRAVRRGSVAIVEMLLEKGVNVNNQTNNGMTALMMACEQKEICLVALLLKFGANSSLCTSDTDQGETALMKAIKKQNRDAVNLMLRTGVNFAAPNCNSISALDVAVERRNIDIENILRSHMDRLTNTFEDKVLETLQDTAQLVDKLFPVQCFPLRESQDFTVKFTCYANPLATGEGFLLFIAHTKINDKGVRCRFHGSCPIASVILNGVTQTPLTKEVNFVTSCHPIVSGCNSLVISKHPDYTSKAKLMVCAYRAKLLSHTK